MATRRKAKSTGTRAVVYIRVSSAGQAADGVSLDDQRERLTAYCKLRGLEIVDVVSDEAKSAFKPLDKRPSGRKVLDLVKRKAVDAVVITRLDRAFRNTADALATVDSWDKAGVGLHVLDFGGLSLDTTTAIGKMILTLLAGMAEFERNLGAERTTAALTHMAKSGNMRIGRDAPFGWRYEGTGLAEVPDEQKVIERVKTLRAAGVALRKVCAALTAAGFRNRAGGEFAPEQLQRMTRGSVRQYHAEQAR